MSKERWVVSELEKRYGVETTRRWLANLANLQLIGDSMADDIDRLADLLDVLLTDPQDGDILQYEAASQRWKNKVATNGGGSSLLEQSVTTITDAQWKALPTGTIEVISAPGAGKAIYCPAVHGSCFAAIKFDWHVDYTNIAARPDVYFRLGVNGGQQNYFIPSGFLTWGFPVLWPLATGDAGGTSEATNDLAELENQPVVMGVLNGALGAFTGGDAANVFTVSVAYYVYDV